MILYTIHKLYKLRGTEELSIYLKKKLNKIPKLKKYGIVQTNSQDDEINALLEECLRTWDLFYYNLYVYAQIFQIMRILVAPRKKFKSFECEYNHWKPQDIV